MIGVFDSGYGGIAILRRLTVELPEYHFVYLGDHAHAPYGSATREQIIAYTWSGVQQLFAMGCTLVILACNTASTNALREMQQVLLPNSPYAARRVLGIVVPTIETIVQHIRWQREREQWLTDDVLGIFATAATVESRAYMREIHKYDPTLCIEQLACPTLAHFIEQGDMERARSDAMSYAQMLHQQCGSSLRAALLGCTHYALIADAFQSVLPGVLVWYDQGAITAQRLRWYLQQHPDLEQRLERCGGIRFVSTSDDPQVRDRMHDFAKQPAPRTSESEELLY